MDTNMGSSIFQAGSLNIDSAAQNLEEEEEFEEIKRRQEEIQSLLTKAMDDFNYDDQSTINSSVNESAHEYAQQYKDANLDNQLEVMYNIRVKEVESLQEKLRALEQHMADNKAQMLQSLMLSEAENDKLRISLKNCQELLVDKTNQIEQQNDQNNRIIIDNESFKQILNKLEQEKASVEYNNQELREQVAILEKGRGTNPLSDAVIQETHHNELMKLQHNLETAISKNRRLEKENATLVDKLNQVVAEKEDLIANKTEVINKLMQNVDQAQDHNRDLLNNVTRLTAENEKFRTQVQELEMNVKMMKGFTDKTEIIKILQKELDKSKNLNTKQTVEFEKLHNEYAELMKEYKSQSLHVQVLGETIASLEKKPASESNAMQTSRLMESFSVTDKLKDELEYYKNEYTTKESLANDLIEKIKMLEQDVLSLSKKLELSSQRDSLTASLQEKATRLEEFIINNTKPQVVTKSTNTETIESIPTKQSHEQISQDEMLNIFKTQFETELIEKEIELRKHLQLEFDANYDALKKTLTNCEKCFKLSRELEGNQRQILELKDSQEKMLEQIKSTQTQRPVRENCELCEDMSVNLMKNMEIIQHQEAELEKFKINQQKDKMVIMQVLSEWKSRFELVEHENNELKQRLGNAIESYTRSQSELNLVRKSEQDLVGIVQSKARNAVVTWSRDTLQLVKTHNQKIRAAQERIDRISCKTDNHVKDIEINYNKTRLELKRIFKDNK